MNIADLAKDIDVDEPMFIELIDVWIQSTGDDIAAMEAEFDVKNALKVVEYAHKIKGASAQLGFFEISETAKKIEHNARAQILTGFTEAVEALKVMREGIIKMKSSYLSASK